MSGMYILNSTVTTFSMQKTGKERGDKTGNQKTRRNLKKQMCNDMKLNEEEMIKRKTTKTEKKIQRKRPEKKTKRKRPEKKTKFVCSTVGMILHASLCDHECCSCCTCNDIVSSQLMAAFKLSCCPPGLVCHQNSTTLATLKKCLMVLMLCWLVTLKLM